MKSKSAILNLLLLLFALLLIFSMVRMLNNGSPLTLTSFLDYIHSAPQVVANGGFVDLSIVGDWGIFNFLRDFLNIFTGLLSCLLYLGGMLVQTITYLVWFVKYLFIG